MAIAHVCDQCGADLSRRRATREPHYGLWIVTCSGCGTSSVRQRHEISASIMRFHRLHMALEALLLKGLISGGLLVAAVGAAWGVTWVIPPGMGLRLEEVVGVAVASLLVLPLVTGVWLSTALTHHPRWKVWLVWWSIPAGLLVIGSAAYLLTPGPLSNYRDYGATIEEARAVLREHRLRDVSRVLGVGLPACAIMGGVSLAGLPIGRLVNWVMSHARRWRWRWVRARRRRWLQST